MRLLSPKQTADLLSIGMSTLYKLIKQDTSFPQRIDLAGKKMFVDEEVKEWVLKQRNNADKGE